MCGCHAVCIYGLCCAEGDPGIQCQSAELPRWAQAAQMQELESRCENGGMCMRRLVDTDDTRVVEVAVEALLGERCERDQTHAQGAEGAVDCSARFVQGDPSSCGVYPAKPGDCQYRRYTTPRPFDAEFGVWHADDDGIPPFDRKLPAQNPGVDGAPATQTWVRYCRCPENFYGAMCEMEMDPADVILYALFSLLSTTWFFSVMLAHREAAEHTVVVGRYFREHLLVAPRSRGESRRLLSHNDVDPRMLTVAVMVGAFEQLMMVAGVLSRSVAWSTNFVLVEILQDVSARPCSSPAACCGILDSCASQVMCVRSAGLSDAD